MRVGIIGAGAAGLAAAYEFGKAGCPTVVYERAPFLGGQASTFDVGGAPLERGYHHLFTSDRAIIDLVEEIGLGKRMRWFESTVGILSGDGRIYSLVTPLDLLRFTPLSLPDRIRLGAVTMLLNWRRDWKGLEGYTADEWIRRWAGPGVYRTVWGPLLRGKFGEQHFAEVGMPWFWGKIHTRFASRGRGMSRELLGYPMGSFGEVFDVLAGKVRDMDGQVHLSAAVERIVVRDGRAVGLSVGTGADAHEESFDAVLATTPSYVLPSLVPPLPDDYAQRLSGVTYMAAVLIILVLDRPLTGVYWLNVADRSIPFVGVIEHTNMIDPSLYGGRHIVYLSNYLTVDHPLYGLSHEELLAEYLPHLRKVNPDFDESWILDSHHHRVAAAQPVIGTGYSARIPDHRTPIDRLYLANTTQIYPEDRGTNYSVRMGRQVAQMMLRDLA